MTIEFVDLKQQYQNLKTDIDAAIARVLAHGQYILGPEVAELERKLADYAGVRHCIGVSDGTTALQIALMALEIGPGDEVITTAFSFAATAEVILLVGARPVFVDIDPHNYNIDPAAIEAAITPRTRAVMPVSLYGQCADFDAIEAICRRHGLPIVEDGAQSFGARYRGRRSCSLSTIGCTSFFPSKPLGGYGDGGACFTDDDELARRMRQIRTHGQDGRYHHVRLGLNGRLDTLQAAILLAKLAVFDRELELRDQAAARYQALLADCVATPKLAEGCSSAWAQYTVELDERERVAAALKAAGIPTAVHYPTPLHLQPAFLDPARPAGALPVAERLARRVLSLPMHPYLDQAQQTRVADGLRAALR